jgi:hypothetical protein
MTQNSLFALCVVFLVSCADADKSKTTTVATVDSNTTVDSKENATMAEPLMDSATMMANWTAYMKPGPMHEMMKSWNGNWAQETTTWDYPGAEPRISKGKCVNEMILGGRYQRSTNTGQMMGMPFQGISTTSYDNGKKTFKSTWIDNVGTGMAVMEGPWDEMSKSMSLAGTMVDPSSADGKEMAIRQLYKVEDEKHHTMQMFMPGTDGKEFMMMEIKFIKM